MSLSRIFHVDLLHSRCMRFGVILSLVIAGWFTLGALEPPSLAARIAAIMDSQEAQEAFWGIYVQDVASGQVLYSQNAQKTMLPASNQKILTSAAALDALGSEHRYQTTLYFDGRIQGSVLQGDLIIKGSGDPTFGSTQVPGGDPLRDWARRLAAMGVTRIEGRIIGDDDVFDDKPYAEGWDVDYLLSQASRLLGVSTCGLSYNDNVVEVKIEADGANKPPRITMRPAGYLDIRNRLTTSTRSRGIAVSTNRIIGTETIELTGSLPRSYAGTIVMPATNPTAFTLHSFKAHLQQAGIDVNAKTYDIDMFDEKPAYRTDNPLFVYLSPPLSEILKIVNKASNNFYAEQVFRTFSWGGSAAGGENRIKTLLARAGANTEGISIRDGSGLSRKDLITPSAMGRLLAYMYKHPERDVFLGSLAQGGEASSTLRYRLHNVAVEAKTGSLEYVRALSGYTRTHDGRVLAFALFANNYTMPSYRVTQTIDRIVMELANGAV